MEENEKKDEITTLLTNATSKISELTLTLKDRDVTISKLEGELKTLSEWKKEREERDLSEEVELAFSTYKDTKKLSDSDKPDMFATLKAAPDAFRRLYPRVKPEHQHLQRNLTDKRTDALPKTVIDGDSDAPKHAGETFLQTTKRLMKEQNLSYTEAQNAAFKLRAG